MWKKDSHFTLCHNPYCGNTLDKRDCFVLQGHRFCSESCVTAWQNQNDKFVEAADPHRAILRRPVRVIH